MNRRRLFWMLLIALIAMFVLGCGNSDDNNNNDNPLIIDDPTAITGTVADWLIYFVPDDGSKNTNAIMATYLKPTGGPTLTDVVELFIDGVNVPLPPFMGTPGIYFGTYDLTPGTSYPIQFKVNGVQKVSTSLVMINPASNFSSPEYYVINQPSELGWTLTNNNQHQYVGVSGYKDNYPADPSEDEYFVELPPAARNYTIPANAIDDLGTGAEYSLGVTQANYSITSKVACMSFQGSFSSYGGTGKTRGSIEMYKKALALYKATIK